jgi:DNA adenine methylase
MKNKIKAILKWAGGKSLHAPLIYKEFQSVREKNRYIEPFFGGGSVYFYIAENNKCLLKRSIINDTNKDLIELYINIKKNPKRLIEEHEKMIKSFKLKDYSEGYYMIRGKFNGINQNKNRIKKYSGIERSAALMVLNKTCFNGLYRVNSKGLFNVPKGSYKAPSYVQPELINAVNKVLPNLQNIKSKSYSDIEYKKNDLVYFDPPYDPINKTSSFTRYSGEFGDEEQKELCALFNKLDKMGVHVILSNNNTRLIRQLYKDHQFKTINCSRSINSKKDKRGKIQELIIVGKNFGK